MIHSSSDPAWTVGCIDPFCAEEEEEVQLNASALSDSDSFRLILSSLFVPDFICTLLDCGSTHYFIDTLYVHRHTLPVYDVPLK
jgi:hypothetical protein